MYPEFLYQYKIKNTLNSIKSCNYDFRLHDIRPFRYTKRQVQQKNIYSC
jgi:hypothetical protein